MTENASSTLVPGGLGLVPTDILPPLTIDTTLSKHQTTLSPYSFVTQAASPGKTFYPEPRTNETAYPLRSGISGMQIVYPSAPFTSPPALTFKPESAAATRTPPAPSPPGGQPVFQYKAMPARLRASVDETDREASSKRVQMEIVAGLRSLNQSHHFAMLDTEPPAGSLYRVKTLHGMDASAHTAHTKTSSRRATSHYEGNRTRGTSRHQTQLVEAPSIAKPSLSLARQSIRQRDVAEMTALEEPQMPKASPKSALSGAVTEYPSLTMPSPISLMAAYAHGVPSVTTSSSLIPASPLGAHNNISGVNTEVHDVRLQIQSNMGLDMVIAETIAPPPPKAIKHAAGSSSAPIASANSGAASRLTDAKSQARVKGGDSPSSTGSIVPTRKRFASLFHCFSSK